MSCSTPGYDFSLIRQSDLVYFDPRLQLLYTFRPCGAVLSPNCNFNSSRTELCQQFTNGTSVSAWPHDASLPYPLERVDDSLLDYQLTRPIDAPGCYNQSYIDVEFACNPNVTSAQLLFVNYVAEVCGWQLYVETRYACPALYASSSSSSSSSTGPQVTPCANALVNVWPLSYQTDLVYMSNNALFILHPCSPVYFAECEGASLCLISGLGNVTRLVDYQSWLPSSSFPLHTDGYTLTGYMSSYTYTDNETCSLNPSRFGQSVNVVFLCDLFAVPARLTYVSVDWSACHHTAYVNSTFACPPQLPAASSSSSSSVAPYSSTSSSSAPIVPSPCANARVNLSSLSYGVDLALANDTDESFVVFHPCHSLVVADCHNSTLCRRYANGTAEPLVGWNDAWQSANYSLSTHAQPDGGSFSYYLVTDEAAQCTFEGLTYPKQALVLFHCNESVVDGAVLISVEPQQPHPVIVPCQWQVTVQSALACTGGTWTPPSSTGQPMPSSPPAASSATSTSPSSPPSSSDGNVSPELNLVASFAVVLLSACLLVVLLIVYRVRARRLLPYSGAMAMNSPSSTQQVEENYQRIA